MSIEKTMRHAKRRTLERLTALRDEAKLQLHLLSLEAQKGWSELEKEILALEERANREGEHLADASKQTAHALTRQLSAFMASQISHSAGLATSVRSLMATHVNTCRPGDSLARAAQLMWEGDSGAVPVLADDRIVGIITDRDICMAVYTRGQPPGALPVESAMSKDLYSCSADESIADVLATMADKRVRRLPVTDAEGRLLGIITLADISRWARSLANPEVEDALVDALGAISSRPRPALQAAAE